ncbi:MAG: S-adenosylmethionine:tRNA ribosyltransferase-isomerase [Bacteroidales bacterium]|nr:S-adenosylmethionine:tRNA ribosyltransferase-isomerase [Bacteroidales bacterium]
MIPHIDTALYDYELPEERIARYPLAQRDGSKLLVYNQGEIGEARFADIESFLPKGGVTMVFNNTKVIRARLMFHKETGAQIEIFCLEPLVPAEVQQAFVERRSTTWKCIIGNSKKWKEGELRLVVATPKGDVVMRAERVKVLGNASEICFRWDNEEVTFAELIENAGVMPIPPYLNRETENIDNTRYQTVYSEHKGSVAAPTAGLHFTDDILAHLKAHGNDLVNLTLHVGAGTFKPVQTKDVEQHVMHAEHVVVEADAIRRIGWGKKPLVAVGTTSVRTLESIYWLGVKLLAGKSIDDGLSQWDAYELPQDYSSQDALSALLDWMEKNNTTELHSVTQIMIMPGYKFRIVDMLVTNFHQPHSTLLLLIGAFIGLDWHKVYDYALANDFRFLSYGDSSLLIPKCK